MNSRIKYSWDGFEEGYDRTGYAREFPSIEEIRKKFLEWEKRFSDRFRFEVVGKSQMGRDIFRCEVSDFSVSDDNKQNVLITASEHGGERNPTTTVIKLMEMLMSDDERSCRIREKVRVVIFPCANPDGYECFSPFSANGECVYAGYDFEGNSKTKEGEYIVRTIKELIPELMISVHGTWRDYDRCVMQEDSGVAMASIFSRSYHRYLIEQMNKEGEKYGFAYANGEDDDERLIANNIPEGCEHKFYSVGPWVNSPGVAYSLCHSLAFTMEVANDFSGAVRLYRALELGVERWRGQFYEGYPVNVIGPLGLCRIVSAGRTVRERRYSRAELWNDKIRNFCYGTIQYPLRGASLFYWTILSEFSVFTTTHPEKRLLVDGLFNFLEENCSGADVGRLREIFAEQLDYPVSAYSPITGGYGKTKDSMIKSVELTNSFGLQIRLPFKVNDVRLYYDGILVERYDEIDSHIWSADNWSYFQIDIPGKFLQNGMGVFAIEYSA